MTSNPSRIGTARTRSAGSTLARLKDENSALLHREIRNRATVYRALPEVVTLNHTDICNLRCIMCPRNLAQGTHRLDHRVLSHVANQLFPTARKLVLTTSAGEPLGADFDYLLEHALRQAVKVDAVTNGVLLTRDLYARARGALDHLNVSLDSHVPEVYERIRLGSSHARVFGNLANIRDLRAAEPDDVLLSVSAVVMCSNLPHLGDFVRAAAGLGVDGVVLQRLAQATKPTPQEAPEYAFSAAEVEQALAAAETAAREVGMNLFMTEFGRPPVLGKPLRSKVPATVEGHGTCWFVAQNFGVMYTGEVYPCCIPTDHVLGNVLYQDPVEIWNDRPFRRLRAAQLSGRGTPFCSGCLHAPHLKPRRSEPLNRVTRRARMAVAHVRNSVVRRYRARRTGPIFDPGRPDIEYLEMQFERRRDAVRSADSPIQAEALHVPAGQRGIWWLQEGALYHSAGLDAGAELRGRVAPRRTGPLAGAAVLSLDHRSALLSFEHDGRLLRYDGERITTVLEFPDDRSFVRPCGLAVQADGTVWVGEYGVQPGARCARMFRSIDGGRTFTMVRHLRAARHVHVVYPATGQLLVTTGDLAGERRMYSVADGRQRFRTLRSSWSGYTAIAQNGSVLHAGTDLSEHNGLLRFARGVHRTPEFRRLPADCDAPVRRLITLRDGRLLAWCRVEDDPSRFGAEHWAALLLSEDDGRSWALVYRVFGAADEVPESVELAADSPARLLTVMGSAAAILEVR